MSDLITTVANVRGRSPNEWQRHSQNVYVGRNKVLCAGSYAGQQWNGSMWCNFQWIEDDASLSARLSNHFNYAITVRERLRLSAIHRNDFPNLRGKVLGCWCCEWDGIGHQPFCHAAWLARIVDLYFEPTATGVVVTRNGKISLLHNEEASRDVVVIRKTHHGI